jgi:N-acetyl sugar amidotransferase
MNTIIKKKNLLKLYNLPEEVIYCKKCTISNQRPRITFDIDGVCSACNFANYKKNKINWKEREAELIKLCNKFRRKNGEYDVVVPCSGGKDGSFVAHQLKFKYQMNPLCVTWSPLRYTEIGKKNLENFIQSGFAHILGTPDPKITRKLTELSLKEVGDPFQPFIYGQANFPLDIALKYKINLIMYGENGEVEYGGDKKNAHKPTQELLDRNKHYFSNMPAEVWEKYGINKSELKPFLCPDLKLVKKNKTEIHFFGYYKFWDPQENFYYVMENCNFTTNSERNEMTHTKYASLDDRFDAFHYYLSYIKFGLARIHSDTAHEIRDEKINRVEGIALVKKFENEFPKKYYKEFLEFCSIDDDTFTKIIDSWRSDHIWFKDNHGIWKLKNPIWK